MNAAAALLLAAGLAGAAPLPAELFVEVQESSGLDEGDGTPAASFVLRRAAPEPTMAGNYARARVVGNIRTWQLQIFDREERKVAYVQGRGDPPHDTIKWWGKDMKGDPLPNGIYSARLAWTDEQGRFHKSPFVTVGKLSLDDLRGFIGPYVSLNRDGRALVFRVRDRFVFDTGEARVREDALPTLDRLCRFLRAGSANRLVVHGTQNQEEARLTKPREEALLAYLAEQQVDRRRLQYR